MDHVSYGEQYGFRLMARDDRREGRIYTWWHGAASIRASAAGVSVQGTATTLQDGAQVLNYCNALGEAHLAFEWLKTKGGFPSPGECPFRNDVTRSEGTA